MIHRNLLMLMRFLSARGLVGTREREGAAIFLLFHPQRPNRPYFDALHCVTLNPTQIFCLSSYPPDSSCDQDFATAFSHISCIFPSREKVTLTLCFMSARARILVKIKPFLHCPFHLRLYSSSMLERFRIQAANSLY